MVEKISTKLKPDLSDDEDDLPLVFRRSNQSEADVEENADSDDDKPLRAFMDSDPDDNKPLSSRLSQSNAGTSNSAKEKTTSKRHLDHKAHQSSSVKKQKISVNKQASANEEPEEEEDIPIAHRMKKARSVDKSSQTSTQQRVLKVCSSSKAIKKGNRTERKSKDETNSEHINGQKKNWTSLSHNGVMFPPPYKPHGVKMLYNGKRVHLTPEQEEVATMFAVMKDTKYVELPKFRMNFWKDWQKLLGKKHVIQELDACDFQPIYDWYAQQKEKKKLMSKEEKAAAKEKKRKQEWKYKWAIVDGVQEEVKSFIVEPPGLFRGRGEHPRSGSVKRRIRPSDVTINIGKNAPVPECPIPGESWKEIRHDNTVEWLACWNDPIMEKKTKYVNLASTSSKKGQSDKKKYETARNLKKCIGDIRAAYNRDFKEDGASLKRQIAVATYLIDKFAIRAGTKKDTDEEADTVGCCTLKVENVEPIPPKSLKFDFLGKDSVKYDHTHEVEPLVYKAVKQFRSGKASSDLLFDQLNTNILNAHLGEFMPDLTAKVFRTYNASITLDNILNEKTEEEGDVSAKVKVFEDANKQVAILCNHQRAEPKTFGEQISRLNKKIEELRGVKEALKTDLDRERKGKHPPEDADRQQKRNLTPEALEKKMAQTENKIEKLERTIIEKEDKKNVALGTSKINYLDPRITVAWCKLHEVPIQKIFNASVLKKFSWAMDTDPYFRF